MIEVKVKRLMETAKIPTKGSEEAAGFDLYAAGIGGIGLNIVVPSCVLTVKTGIAMEIPRGYFGAIFARSGLATKFGLRPPNCVGVIDSDYRGEILVPLRNDSSDIQHVNIGDRVAQLVILPCPEVELTEVQELPETGRGTGGFGSTGK